MKERLLAFYGDDFTGSTDALEFLCRAGIETVLFIEPPREEQLLKYPSCKAIGIAGKTRSLSPVDMQEILAPAFRQLKELKFRHVHYKVCSTFDSSSHIGSIGKAIDVGASIFQNVFTPILAGTPALGRYCVFGNLFARMGIGSAGDIYRLDRHPSMRKHPVTPSNESDLIKHLSKQTTQALGLLDVLQLQAGITVMKTVVEEKVQKGNKVILMDALYDEHLPILGELLEQYAVSQPLFSVGSSSVEMALGKYWNNMKQVHAVSQWPVIQRVVPLLVISGSCSPVTAGQIAWAKQNGFEEVVIDLKVNQEPFILRTINKLKEGKHVIVHTDGTENKALESYPAEQTGAVLGSIAKAAMEQVPVKRLVIAGGDTSSYAARALGIRSVEMIAPLIPGAPLCKAKAYQSPADGIEVNFKGGQVGTQQYFGILSEGKMIL